MNRLTEGDDMGLKAEVLALFLDGVSMTSGDVRGVVLGGACDSSAVCTALAELTKEGSLVRSVSEHSGRYVYRRATASPCEATAAPRDPSPAVQGEAPSAPEPTATPDSAASDGPPPPVSTAAPAQRDDRFTSAILALCAAPPGSSYDLVEHIEQTALDLEDLCGEAVDRDAPKTTLRALLTAQACLRRAQTEVLRARVRP